MGTTLDLYVLGQAGVVTRIEDVAIEAGLRPERINWDGSIAQVASNVVVEAISQGPAALARLEAVLDGMPGA